MREWPGLSLEDAMPLRVAGGLHWLHLSGEERARLAPGLRGRGDRPGGGRRVVAAVAVAWDASSFHGSTTRRRPNEAGRSSSVIAGLLWLSQRLGPRFEMNEIGASAGVNTMMERYRYDLGGVEVGPAVSPMRLKPEWARVHRRLQAK
jgi:hypothetical protein